MPEIILLNAPMVNTEEFGKVDFDNLYSPPLGISYLAAYLEQNGFDVSAADMYYDSWEKTEALFTDPLLKIVGISCWAEQRISVWRAVRFLKKHRPGVKIILGGPLPTFMFKQIMEYFPVDAVVIGEGEQSLLALVEVFLGKRDAESLQSLPGIGYRSGGNIRINADFQLTRDLHWLPFPAFRHFQDVKYAPVFWAEDEIWHNKKISDLKYVCISASRGCPRKCQFCSTPAQWKGKRRMRAPQNIVEEMHSHARQFGYEFFGFGDDIFTIDREWAYELCREMLAHDIVYPWICETCVDMVSADLLKLMKAAGCVSIAYGVESFSTAVLKNIHKGIGKEQVLRAFSLTREAGITSEMYLMVGNPGDSEESVKQAKKMVEEIKPNILSVSIATPFPGTELYNLSVQNGLLDDNFWVTDSITPYYTVENDEATLIRWKDELEQTARDCVPFYKRTFEFNK